MGRLIKAVANHDFLKVKELLDHGTNINKRDMYGITPLIKAIVDTNLEMTNYLLSRGASVHLKSRHGESPLLFALFAVKEKQELNQKLNLSYDGKPLIEVLLKAGAEVHAHSNDMAGRTLIEKAQTFFPEYLDLLNQYSEINQILVSRNNRDNFLQHFKELVHENLETIHTTQKKVNKRMKV